MRCSSRPARPSGGCGRCRRGSGCISCWPLPFSRVGFGEGVGEHARRPRRRAAGVGVGQGVAGSAPPGRRRAGEGAVRGAGRAGGPAARPRACGSAGTGRWPSTAACRSRCPTPTATGPGWASCAPRSGVTGYPVVKLMTLVETGTRALLGAVFGPPATGETDYARRLLGLLDPDMLVLIDRGFDAGAVPHRAGRHRRAVPGPAALDPQAAGAGPLRRRLLPVAHRRADGAGHHRRHHRHLRRRHPLHRELPAGHHPDRPAPLSRPRADRAVPRTLGTRDRLPGAAAHPRRGPGAALHRPGRAANRRCGRCSPSTRRCGAPW